ncbi:thiamine pyrophosphate-binding protein [Roseomonas sp. AR75]|uniref:thiamine pyrophosphate-binding protein n=1 Tax=Roseomonas sp. AR75 TaxID=2562311 RepID=UPI001485416A|nr:thiamine pyrophosphate-binding protein [Roseomonas sp. AR75]
MPDDMGRGAAPATVAEALLADLARRGTRRIWGVPGGGSSLDLLLGMPRFGIDFVLTKHEGAAAMAALADAELTGAPGVVLTTKGPGVGNALNGLACASLERAPVVLVSDGFTPQQLDWVTHQVFDQRAASAPYVAGYDTGEDAASIAALLDTAHRERRPVHLDLTGTTARRAPGARKPRALAEKRAPNLGHGAALLLNARRPVLIAGLEAAEPDAAVALRELAEALGAPVLVTYKAKGVLPDAHPLHAGIFTGGALEAPFVATADLILTVGLDPVELILQPWPYQAPVVDIARRPFPVRYVAPSATLHGPLAASLRGLHRAVHPLDWTMAEIEAHRARAEQALTWDGDRFVSPPDIVRIAQQEARRAGLAPRVAVDAGAHMFSATAFWQCEAPRDLLISNGLASMGYALPAGIAAALHDPARGAICFTGDGGLMMVAGELATAAAAGARLVTVVFNDGALSLIDIKQQSRQLPPAGVRWTRPDFARVAEGFGVTGFVATDAESYRDALRAAFALDGPSLIDVHVDPAGYPAQLRAMRG